MKWRNAANVLSIQTQIAAATIVLCVALVAIGSLTAAYIGERKTSALIGVELAELARSMADRLDRGMFERYREIGIVAQLEPLQDTWKGDPAVLRRTLEHIQKSFPDYAWIGFAGLNGQVVAATNGMLVGASVAERPWFREGQTKPFIGDVHEAALLANLLKPKPSREPFRFVDIAYPVHDRQGAVIGVLGAHLSWDWAEEARRAVLNVNEHFTGAEVMVLDETGKVLLGPHTGEMLLDASQMDRIRAGKHGYGLRLPPRPDHWLNGYAVSTGYRDYPGLGWIAVARQPVHVANAPVRDLVNTIMIAGGLLSLIGGAIAWWLAGWLTSPIRQITLEAERIGRSPDAQTLPRTGGAREVAQLSRALRSLLRRLGTTEDRLHEAERDIEEKAAAARDLSADIERLQKLAETDPLTGLLNRRAFLDAARRQVAYAQRYNRKLSIVVADIDHFKLVNDRHGHGAGDAVIKDVAARLRNAARDTDLVARFGGEEFVVLLMESDISAGAAYAERVRLLVEGDPVIVETAGAARPVRIRTTLSFGCTVFAADDRDIQDAIDRADGALYSAKAAGRNRVRLSAPQQAAAE